MELKDSDKIELRSDEVREILTRPPHALIRYGVSVIYSVILVLLVGSFFFKYPDIVAGKVVITTENPPVWIVARSSGRLKELSCKDKQEVSADNLLAVIDNAAQTRDVKYLNSLLNKVVISDSVIYVPLELYTRSFELGELQTVFSSFTRAAITYDNFLSANLTNQEKTALQKQLSGKRVYLDNLQRQRKLKEDEIEISRTTYEREKALFKRGVISKSELETAEKVYLNMQQSLEQLQTSVINGNIESVQMNESVKKLSLQYLQDKNQYYTELKSSFRELVASVMAWRQNYLLISPVEGIVTFNTFWQKDQFVEAGSKVFAVISKEHGNIVGKMAIQASGIGKVKIGQFVNIKLDGYPYMEYGILKGKIKSISLIPAEDNYTLEVSLNNDLTTNTNRLIDFTGELAGQAEIITDDRSLGERLISPLKYLWKEKVR